MRQVDLSSPVAPVPRFIPPPCAHRSVSSGRSSPFVPAHPEQLRELESALRGVLLRHRPTPSTRQAAARRVLGEEPASAGSDVHRLPPFIPTAIHQKECHDRAKTEADYIRQKINEKWSGLEWPIDCPSDQQRDNSEDREPEKQSWRNAEELITDTTTSLQSSTRLPGRPSICIDGVMDVHERFTLNASSGILAPT